jgi:hypothetical protein
MSIEEVEPNTLPISKKPSPLASPDGFSSARVLAVGRIATKVSSTSGPI